MIKGYIATVHKNLPLALLPLVSLPFITSPTLIPLKFKLNPPTTKAGSAVIFQRYTFYRSPKTPLRPRLIV